MNDLLLLATLLGGRMHGYALKKQAGLIVGQAEIHNNLVYPLLRRFVDNGWVSKRAAAGKRGQTREVYELTPKGKRELLRRLTVFTEKEAGSESEFNLRVGLFVVLDREARERILRERERWLAAREERLATLTENIDVGMWGGKVVGYLRERVKAERKWIAGLEREVKRESGAKDRSGQNRSEKP
jgi:DNA-binding PadR family transcriptional regulator